MEFDMIDNKKFYYQPDYQNFDNYLSNIKKSIVDARN